VGRPAVTVSELPVPHEHIAELVPTLPDGGLVTLDAGHLLHATRRPDAA